TRCDSSSARYRFQPPRPLAPVAMARPRLCATRARNRRPMPVSAIAAPMPICTGDGIRKKPQAPSPMPSTRKAIAVERIDGFIGVVLSTMNCTVDWLVVSLAVSGMVRILAGPFIMGGGDEADEQPRRTVTVAAFDIDADHVTR